ncbi:hypothetical protein [Pseudomonas fluorescens]|uniref:hypothetical protein n=1 Tax=Pseudomonas fluorescens TaxID=294 RepID=UPI0005C58C49|nr:hypothetical protein [Pseudomonas fluorescens]
MNPDWSKAPQATHYTSGNPEDGLNAVYWRVIEGVTVKAWAVRSSGSIAECLSSCAFDLNRPDVIVKVWDGEGLPPVGTVCEFAGGTNCPEDPFDKDLKEGDEVTIIAHFKDGESKLAAFTFNPRNLSRGNACVEQGMHGCFRPVRTPEQIESDKRISEIHALSDELAGYEGVDGARARHHNMALYLVDQGYRKQVTE